MRVLVVEDELKMARALRRGLEQEGNAVDATPPSTRHDLTLAHRDEHRLELVLAPVDLASVASAVTTQLRPLADQGGVRLTVRAGGDRQRPRDRQHLRAHPSPRATGRGPPAQPMSRVRYQDRPHLSADPSMRPATIQLVTSVWVGDPTRQTPMGDRFGGGPVYGGTFPALIFHDFMAAVLAGPPPGPVGAASGPRPGPRWGPR